MYIKKLKIKLRKSIGRNGKILCFTKKGLKLNITYRFVDFYLNSLQSTICVYIKYLHDSFRNAKLILCLSLTGFYFYILGPGKLNLPIIFNTSFGQKRKFGSVINVMNCLEGDFIFNISLYKNSFGQLCRSSGKFAQIMKNRVSEHFVLLKLKNGQKVLTYGQNNCLFGVVNNVFLYNMIRGKAGISSNYGAKSIVRGVAKNPIDHPNGGRTPGGKVYRSFSFKIARSKKRTRSNSSNYYF
jgi:large subunit ribosomal protein L2